MPAAQGDDFDGMPSPSFNGGLKQFIYTSPSKPGLRKGTKAPVLPRAISSPKRKLDEISDDSESAVRSSNSSPTPATVTTTTSVRITRSRSAQQTSLSASRTARTQASCRSRSRTSTPSNAHDNGDPDIPSLATVAATGLSRLRDTIPPGLIVLFIGVNPGIMTGQTGFVYAHPSNLYWKLLHHSGVTTHRHPPSDTYRLPELYAVGNTNIVTRSTKDASMLSKAEMDAGVSVLEEKIAKNRPEAVCLVGKSIWEAVWRVRKGRNIKKEEFRYGWQDESENMGRVQSSGEDGWGGARVFVATTTSGLAASMSLAEKQAVWKELGEWVKQRRAERGIPEPSLSEALGVSNPA